MSFVEWILGTVNNRKNMDFYLKEHRVAGKVDKETNNYNKS